jgi:FMN phosphatase YigB (HAD superfamily)
MIFPTERQGHSSRKKTIIFDVDHVINHYGEDYAREFSVATATSFIELHPEKAKRFDIDELTDLAIASYRKTRRTTSEFAKRFNIDEMELYVHHHNAMCEKGGFIDRQFEYGHIRHDPELEMCLSILKGMGYRLLAVSNGTQGYVEKTLGAGCHKVGHLFDGLYGMDSFNNPYMLDKRHGAFWSEILEMAGLHPRFETAKGDKMPDKFWDDDMIFIDDTHDNHRAPRFIFNMQTVLKTDSAQRQMPSFAHIQTHNLCYYLKSLISQEQVRPPAPALRVVS